jgi:adenylate cyclase
MEGGTRTAEKLRAPRDEDAGRLRKAEVLLNVYRRTAALESLDEMLHAIVDVAARETGAERGTLFLHNEQTGELYSRVAQGRFSRELRLPITQGIAGDVFRSGKGVIVHDAYQSEHFDASHDEQTGFLTRSVLCAPVRTVRGTIIGVIQMLNKEGGEFTEDDLALLEEMAAQTSDALRQTQLIERMRKTRAQELRFLEIVSDVTSELELEVLLKKVMEEASRMLDAERSTIFLNDEKTGELWSLVGEGLKERLRFPNHLGIAGAVFQSGKSIDIPYAYADLRFNPTFDRKSGFFTRSILCVPIVNKDHKVIGVTQALNKRGGAFTSEDEARLRAFTAQVSIALENAKLFTDVQNIKNYNESILESMSSGVITLDEEGKIVTCNAAGLRLLRVHASDLLGKAVDEFFHGENAWVLDTRKRVEESQSAEILMGADLVVPAEKLSVNVTVLPLRSVEKTKLGSMIMIEDISVEKRMKSTMSLYIDPKIANRMLEGGAEILGGKSELATVLFSDIRDFTTVTEELGPQGTVRLLNDYFSVMVESIHREEGMLDKFIGDAMMAAFGLPIPHGDDEDRAMRAAISMTSDLDRWNTERAANGQRMVHMGIGINTDTVVAGNIGSPKRMNYTLIGDGVNLASRLEGLCKEYGTRILISENTRARLRGTYRVREVDRVVVKGKTEPIAVYEVLDYHNDDSFPELVECVGHYNDGLSEYRKRRWDRAVKSFREALRLNPKDKLAEIYVERSALYLQAPPPDDWDGTFVMKTK